MLARLACALDALWVARPSLFAAASGAAAVIPSLVSKPLSSAASLTLARGGALGLGWWSKLGWLPSVPQTTLLLGGRLGVVLLLCYTAYWFAFPLEVGGRFMWSSSLSPKQEHVNTLSARLLRGLKIVRPDFKVVELLRRRDLLINGGRGMGSIRASGGAVGASAETASVRQRAGDDSRLMLWHASADDFVQDEESGGGVFSSDLGQLGSEEDMMGLAAQQEDNRWAFMELGRLFFAEDATGRAAAAGIKEDNIKRIPPEMRWSRDESETTVRAMFEDRTKFLGNQSDEVLAETLMLKFALEAWNEDQPDDYEPSRIEPTPMTEELQRAEERMRKAAGREPGGGGFALLDAERSAEDAQAMVASEVTGDEGLEGLGLAAEAAPETVRVAEDDDDDEDGQDGGSVLFV